MIRQLSALLNDDDVFDVVLPELRPAPRVVDATDIRLVDVLADNMPKTGKPAVVSFDGRFRLDQAEAKKVTDGMSREQLDLTMQAGDLDEGECVVLELPYANLPCATLSGFTLVHIITGFFRPGVLFDFTTGQIVKLRVHVSIRELEEQLALAFRSDATDVTTYTRAQIFSQGGRIRVESDQLGAFVCGLVGMADPGRDIRPAMKAFVLNTGVAEVMIRRLELQRMIGVTSTGADSPLKLRLELPSFRSSSLYLAALGPLASNQNLALEPKDLPDRAKQSLVKAMFRSFMHQSGVAQHAGGGREVFCGLLGRIIFLNDQVLRSQRVVRLMEGGRSSLVYRQHSESRR